MLLVGIIALQYSLRFLLSRLDIVSTGCDPLIIFTSARPRPQSYTDMINTPAA